MSDEPSMPGDGAPVEPITEAPTSRHRERVLELVATIILAAATGGAAWSGYQAMRWGGLQVADYVTASGLRVESTKASTRVGEDRLFDSQVFSQWLSACDAGNTSLGAIHERRFRAHFRPAFEAWLATDPFHNASAPPRPLYGEQPAVRRCDRTGVHDMAEHAHDAAQEESFVA
jgi:hypothetical protein